jgi:hypothetical protein
MQMQANYATVEKNGFTYKRGEFYTTHDEIRDALTVYKNNRRIRPTEKQVRLILEWFKRIGEIETETIRRRNNLPLMISTYSHETAFTGADPRAYVCTKIRLINYDTYQDPKIYKGTGKGTNWGTAKAELGQYNNNDKNNDKNNEENNTHLEERVPFILDTFMDWYSAQYEMHFGKPYFKGTKDLELIGKMLETLTIDDLKEGAEKFFKQPKWEDTILQQAGHTISIFRARINGILTWEGVD